MLSEFEVSVRALGNALRNFTESSEQNGREDIISATDSEALIDELKQLYTPILITGELSARMAEQVAETDSPRAGNTIKFDDETRKAQLISVCARLIAKYKGSPDYKTYTQAAQVARIEKLKMQKDNHAAAVAIANEYLARLAAEAEDPTARQAASALAAVKVT